MLFQSSPDLMPCCKFIAIEHNFCSGLQRFLNFFDGLSFSGLLVIMCVNPQYHIHTMLAESSAVMEKHKLCLAA